ncbi:hypothetical protein [Streptomyces sp. NPDC058739]|uniref:hypothetical protein n=1 Tax=Streptomyces sp. NPDC058739 TaxID=3346618 RepID=UPI003688A04A
MRKTATALLGIAVAAGLLTGCTSSDDHRNAASSSSVATKLPDDPDRTKSRKQAEEFRSWVRKHGTGAQQNAVTRVQKIIGEWDAETATAFISTDINGGPTPVADPMATADAIAEAFTTYTRSQKSRVSVYDVFGNLLAGERRA